MASASDMLVRVAMIAACIVAVFGQESKYIFSQTVAFFAGFHATGSCVLGPNMGHLGKMSDLDIFDSYIFSYA